MDRPRVEALRIVVLELHKVLVDVEREGVERREGRLTPQQFLERLLHDEVHAWLKSMSAVIVGFDEWLDDPDGAIAADGYVDELRRMIVPDPAGDSFQRRYAELMQDRSDVIMAHAAVLRALAAV
jgi:hypothetical protein